MSLTGPKGFQRIALYWPEELLARNKSQEDRPIPEWVCSHAEFPQRVSVCFTSLLHSVGQERGGKVGPLEELILLKQAMREASDNLQKDTGG